MIVTSLITAKLNRASVLSAFSVLSGIPILKVSLLAYGQLRVFAIRPARRPFVYDKTGARVFFPLVWNRVRVIMASYLFNISLLLYPFPQ